VQKKIIWHTMFADSLENFATEKKSSSYY